MVEKTQNKFQPPKTRPSLERMTAILVRLKKGGYPSSAKLAAAMEVTPKTILRDIAFMRDRYNHPIAYDPYKYGYYLTEEVANLPLLQISEGEIVALFIAQKALGQCRGTPFEQPLRSACEKLTESLSDEFSISWGDLESAIAFRPVATSPIDIEIFRNASRAVRERREISFEYSGLKDDRFERREMQPYSLVCNENQWYLLGFDKVKRALRTFVLARMRNLQVLTTCFERPTDFSVKEILSGSFGIVSGNTQVRIRIWVDAFAAKLIGERRWHQSQQMKPLSNGEAEIEFLLTSTVEFLPWVLNWGSHAKVIAPENFAQEVKTELSKAISRYSQA